MAAPAAIAGRIEVRGVGILRVPLGRRGAAAPGRRSRAVRRGSSGCPEPATCDDLGLAVPADSPCAIRGFRSGEAASRAARAGGRPCRAPSWRRHERHRHAGGGAGAAANARAPARVVCWSSPGCRAPGGRRRSRRSKIWATRRSTTCRCRCCPTLSKRAGDAPPIAVGVDVRTRDFGVDGAAGDARQRWSPGTIASSSIVFLDCDDEPLRAALYRDAPAPSPGRRPAGRRRYPPRAPSAFRPLRDRADLVIDTSELTPADLKRLLHGPFRPRRGARLRVFVTSFSLSPRHAARCRSGLRRALPRQPALRRRAAPADRARRARSARYIERGSGPSRPSSSGSARLLEPLLPRYEREGKTYLTIAIGCTGGRHRSVYRGRAAGRMARRSRAGRSALAHRDLDQWARAWYRPGPPPRRAERQRPSSRGYR